MFNFFKQKVSLLGTLSIKGADGKDFYTPVTSDKWSTIEKCIEDLYAGRIKNINLKISDGMNLDRSDSGNISLSYFPNAFLKTASGSYYQIGNLSITEAKHAFKHFFLNQERDASLGWSENNG